MLINTDNVWRQATYCCEMEQYGDASKLNGNIAYIIGDVTRLKGCCSNIHGNAFVILKITNDLDVLQEIFKEYFQLNQHLYIGTSSTGSITVTIYYNLKELSTRLYLELDERSDIIRLLRDKLKEKQNLKLKDATCE